MPATLNGIDGKKVGRPLDERGHLPLRKVQGRRICRGMGIDHHRRSDLCRIRYRKRSIVTSGPTDAKEWAAIANTTRSASEGAVS